MGSAIQEDRFGDQISIARMIDKASHFTRFTSRVDAKKFKKIKICGLKKNFLGSITNIADRYA